MVQMAFLTSQDSFFYYFCVVLKNIVAYFPRFPNSASFPPLFDGHSPSFLVFVPILPKFDSTPGSFSPAWDATLDATHILVS